jgi:hypothetical protein
MGLISSLVTWPLAPGRAVAWLGEKVATEADRQWADPAVIQAQLREIDEMVGRGEMDEEVAAELEEALVSRLLEGGWSHG